MRVLIANEREEQLTEISTAVERLGHAVVARSIAVAEVAAIANAEGPDVALVSLGPDTDHALAMIEQVVAQANCPVIALTHAPSPGFARRASDVGVFAVVSDHDVEDWRSAIEVVLRRYAEYRELQAAFTRRATIERATGILMERHSLAGEAGFAMLRASARSHNRKLIDVASAIVESHGLLPRES